MATTRLGWANHHDGTLRDRPTPTARADGRYTFGIDLETGYVYTVFALGTIEDAIPGDR